MSSELSHSFGTSDDYSWSTDDDFSDQLSAAELSSLCKVTYVT